MPTTFPVCLVQSTFTCQVGTPFILNTHPVEHKAVLSFYLGGKLTSYFGGKHISRGTQLHN